MPTLTRPGTKILGTDNDSKLTQVSKPPKNEIWFNSVQTLKNQRDEIIACLVRSDGQIALLVVGLALWIDDEDLGLVGHRFDTRHHLLTEPTNREKAAIFDAIGLLLPTAIASLDYPMTASTVSNPSKTTILKWFLQLPVRIPFKKKVTIRVR